MDRPTSMATEKAWTAAVSDDLEIVLLPHIADKQKHFHSVALN
jgi:hypothetical protein